MRVHDGAVGGTLVTVTVAVQCAMAPSFVAVPVYVVVTVGETDLEPADVGVTIPMSLSIEKEVELVAVQERVAALPRVIEPGDADRVQLGAFGGVFTTATVAVQCATTPSAVAVPV